MQRHTRNAQSLQEICFRTRFYLKSFESRLEGIGTNLRQSHQLIQQPLQIFALPKKYATEHPLHKSSKILTANRFGSKGLRAVNQLNQAIMKAMLKITQISWAEVIYMAAFFGVLRFLHSARQVCPGAQNGLFLKDAWIKPVLNSAELLHSQVGCQLSQEWERSLCNME